MPAQVVVPPSSEVPLPAKPATDSAAPRPDTIQPPFGRSPLPRTGDIGERYAWDRTELLASGALSVADLLDRVPGAISFRTGWLLSPKLVAVNGDLRKVRLFYDDLELDNLDPRAGAMLDLTTVQLWTLESLTVERLGNEMRVHLRSWRVDRTTPYTRTDVFTGDEETNLYRGFYGKRFGGGQGIQLAAQQLGTTAARLGGGGDALSVMVRAGVARSRWSVDLFANRSHHTRVFQPTFGNGLSIPEFDGTYTLAYARAAIGSPSSGPWGQLVASTMRLAETSGFTAAAEATQRRVVLDTADTTTNRAQYLLSGGLTRGPVSVLVGHRIRAGDDKTSHSPHARLEFATSFAFASAYAERNGQSMTNRGDAVVRVTPLPFLAVAGAVSRVSPDDSAGTIDTRPGSTEARIEAGVRIMRRPWFSVGFITRDTAVLAAPVLFDTSYVPVAVSRRQGAYVALRGRLYKDIGVDVVATQWDDGGYYQPRYQSRSEINIITSWLSRFPSGNFGFKAVLVYDQRSATDYPVALGVRRAAESGIASALIEIRIMRGIISYQVRNVAGLNHQTVPDFFMPRAINLYGVRWEFWN